jgi:drug/metabolite transporter (DMT)-like permease
MTMNFTVRTILVICLLGALSYGAVILDRNWRSQHPSELPFRWGYFQALFFLPGGLVSFLLPFIFHPRSLLDLVYETCCIVLGLFGSFAGYMLIRSKKRWAWWSVVILQLGIIFINAPYGWKRRHEFR